MLNLFPALFAMVVASIVTALELITSKYPHTFFVFKWAACRQIYIYCLIYGISGFAVALGLDLLEQAHVVQLQGFGLDNLWVRALAVGVTIKAFLHVRLFSTTVGNQTFPIGIETIVQMFEPWLLEEINLCEFGQVRDFIEPRAQKYSNIDEVRQLIGQNVPRTIQSLDRKVFLADLNSQETVVDTMELYLRKLGRANFERIFPLGT